MTFKHRQRVWVRSAAGGHRFLGTVSITRRFPQPEGWFVVQFDDDGALSVHADNLLAVR